MKSKITLLAEYIENLFYPNKVIILGGILVILYLIDSGLILTNIATFFGSLIVFYVVEESFKYKLKNMDKIHLFAAIIATIVFFIGSNIFPVSRELKFGAMSLFINLILLFAVRGVWKISAHTSIYTTFCTVLSLISNVFTFTFTFLPLVIWSRIKLKRHTYYQIVIGGIAGSSIPTLIYLTGIF